MVSLRLVDGAGDYDSELIKDQDVPFVLLFYVDCERKLGDGEHQENDGGDQGKASCVSYSGGESS